MTKRTWQDDLDRLDEASGVLARAVRDTFHLDSAVEWVNERVVRLWRLVDRRPLSTRTCPICGGLTDPRADGTKVYKCWGCEGAK